MKLSLIFIVLMFFSFAVYAENSAIRNQKSPEVGDRSYAQIYKDMMFAQCLGWAYPHGDHKTAHGDIVGSGGTINDMWNLSFNPETHVEKVKTLTQNARRKDYSYLRSKAGVKGAQFHLLKCLDFFHGKALDTFVKKVASDRITFRSEHSLKDASPVTPTPKFPNGSRGQLYQDIALAECVATAYPQKDAKILPKDNPELDARATKTILMKRLGIDLTLAEPKLHDLVGDYLARDYSHPVYTNEAPGLEFKFLKCLDLYHGAPLAEEIKEFIPNPEALPSKRK